jgi:hypothetical protein
VGYFEAKFKSNGDKAASCSKRLNKKLIRQIVTCTYFALGLVYFCEFTKLVENIAQHFSPKRIIGFVGVR